MTIPQKVSQKFDECAENFISSHKQWDATTEELTTLYAQRPGSIEEQISYETRIQNILLKQQENFKVLSNSAEKFFKVTDRDHRHKYQYEDKIRPKERKQIRAIHHALKSLLNKGITEAVETNNQMLQQSLQNSSYIEHVLNYARAFTLFQNECQSLYNAQETHDILESITSRVKELQQLADLLGLLSTSSNLHLDINWEMERQKLVNQGEDMQFVSHSQTENLSELNLLFKDQPAEYFHKSFLYQLKLLCQKESDPAVDYGMEWIKSVPKDASNDDLITMAVLFIQAASNASKPHWAGYRKALDLQLKQRDLCLTDQKLSSDPELISRDIGKLELIRGVLFANAEDLSFSASQCYRHCGLIAPDDPKWKFREAECFISAHQWSQAEAILPSLPSKSATTIRKGIAASQSNAYSLGIDFLQLMVQKTPIVFPRLKDNQKFRTIEICIQLSTGVLKELCVPLLTIDPKWPERRTLCLTGINLAVDMTELFHKRLPSKKLQERTLLVANSWKVGSSLYSLYTQRESLSVFSVMNSASTFASVGLRYQPSRSPVFRGICATTQKIHTDMVPLGMSVRYWTSIVGILKYIAIKSSMVTQFDQASEYLGKISKHPKLMGIGITLWATYRLNTYYPQIKTAMIIGEAQSLFCQDRYKESKTLLKKALNSWHVDKKPIQLYADYLDTLEMIFKLIADQEREKRIKDPEELLDNHQKKADQVLIAFGNIDSYSGICEEILYNEIVIAIKLQKKERTKALLKGNIPIPVLEQAVDFFIHYVASQIDADHLWVDDIFPETYKEIITRYREYLSIRKDHPILTHTSPPTIKEQRLQSLEVLLRLIKHKNGLNSLHVQLLCDQFFVYFDTEKNVATYPPLTTLLKKMSDTAQKKVALTLIEDAEQLFEQTKDKVVSTTLRKVCTLKDFRQKKLIEEYEKYLSHRKTCPQLTRNTSQEKDQQLKIIDSFLSQIESDNNFLSLIAELHWHKVRVYLDVESFQEAASILKQEEVNSRLFPYTIMYLVQNAKALYQQEGKQKATEYLANAVVSFQQLPNPNILDILKMFRFYLVHKNEDLTSVAALDDQIAAMNGLLECIRPIRAVSTLYEKLHCEQFEILISAQSYNQAQPIFFQYKANRQVHLQLIRYLVDHLIQRGSVFIEENSINEGKNELIKLSQSFGISENPFIKFYFQFLDCYSEVIEQNNMLAYKKALQSINRLSQEFKANNYPISELISFREIEIYMKIGAVEAHYLNYEAALKAYQSAKKISEEKEILTFMPTIMPKIFYLENMLK